MQVVLKYFSALVLLKWSMGREENLASELLNPVADWMAGWQNFLQPFTWEPATFLVHFLLLFWYLVMEHGTLYPCMGKISLTSQFCWIFPKIRKLKLKIQLHSCDQIEEISPPHSCKTFVIPENDFGRYQYLVNWQQAFLDWEQGVTNINFRYKQIFEYIYIQKTIQTNIRIKNDTNEYPNIFL